MCCKCSDRAVDGTCQHGGGEPGETPDRPGESQVEVGMCSAGIEEP